MLHPTMHRSLSLLLVPLGLVLATALGPQKNLNAQSCNVYMGQAVTGASINVDRCSIRRASERSVNFTYYLGQMKINAQAHCWDNTWTSFHDGVTHSPRSTATQNMLNFVCDGNPGNTGANDTAFVFAPPRMSALTPMGQFCAPCDRAKPSTSMATKEIGSIPMSAAAWG